MRHPSRRNIDRLSLGNQGFTLDMVAGEKLAPPGHSTASYSGLIELTDVWFKLKP